MPLQVGSNVYLTEHKAKQTRDNNLISLFEKQNPKVLSGVIREIHNDRAWVSFSETNKERGNSGQYSIALDFLISAN